MQVMQWLVESDADTAAPGRGLSDSHLSTSEVTSYGGQGGTLPVLVRLGSLTGAGGDVPRRRGRRRP